MLAQDQSHLFSCGLKAHRIATCRHKVGFFGWKLEEHVKYSSEIGDTRRYSSHISTI